MQRTVNISPPGSGPFLCVATYLPVTHWRNLPEFLRLSAGIQEQLRKTPGVVRFSVRAKILRKQFWTCSVWNAPGAELNVADFVSAGQHARALDALPRWHNRGKKFVRWSSASAEIDWPEALKRLAET